jgi:hypothetical protein
MTQPQKRTFGPNVLPEIKAYVESTDPKDYDPHRKWKADQLNYKTNIIVDGKEVYWGAFIQNFSGIEYRPLKEHGNIFRYSTDPKHYPGQIGFIERHDPKTAEYPEGRLRPQMAFADLESFMQTKLQILTNYERGPNHALKPKKEPMSFFERIDIYTETNEKEYDKFVGSYLEEKFPGYKHGGKFLMEQQDPEFVAQMLYRVSAWEAKQAFRGLPASLDITREAVRREWELRGIPLPKDFGMEKRGSIEPAQTSDALASALASADARQVAASGAVFAPTGETSPGLLSKPQLDAALEAVAARGKPEGRVAA